MENKLYAEPPRKRANVCGIVGFSLAVGGAVLFAVLLALAIAASGEGQWPYLIAVLFFLLPVCSAAAFAGAIVAGVGLGRREERRLNGFALAGLIAGVLFGLPALLFFVLLLIG